MRIRFWGTRGSIASPGPRTVRYGGNTSCVELRTASGTLVVLDCGTGANALGRSLLAGDGDARAGHLLVTHTHWDHIQGFPFFSPLRASGEEWHVYGPSGLGPGLEQALSGQMQYTYFPISLEQFAANVRYHDLVEGVFEIGDVRVTARYLNHPALTLGYRIEADGATVVYATDHEPHLRELAGGECAPEGSEDADHSDFLADADLVIHDAQYSVEEYPERVGWGHSTIEYAVEAARRARAARLALYHHDPARDDVALDRLEARAQSQAARDRRGPEVFAAAEGRTWSLERPRTVTGAAGLPRAGTDRTDLDGVRLRGVLLAATDDTVSAVVEEAAAADGFRVRRAADRDALAVAMARSAPALLVLERDFAGEDALVLTPSLRRAAQAAGDELPVVVVAAPERIDAAAGAAAGVTGWLPRPFSSQYARSRLRAFAIRGALRWSPAPSPSDERERLRALHSLEVLDTAPEPRFDRYTRIAAALFDVPIALVSLVDCDRQWFKSGVGIGVRETHRDHAFCAHAILADEVLEIPDAIDDDRFADSPLVTGGPRVRFYAGAPLVLSSGHRVGTLCLMDRRPRTLDEAGRLMLADLADLVSQELEGVGG